MLVIVNIDVINLIQVLLNNSLFTLYSAYMLFPGVPQLVVFFEEVQKKKETLGFHKENRRSIKKINLLYKNRVQLLIIIISGIMSKMLKDLMARF